MKFCSFPRYFSRTILNVRLMFGLVSERGNLFVLVLASYKSDLEHYITV